MGGPEAPLSVMDRIATVWKEAMAGGIELRWSTAFDVAVYVERHREEAFMRSFRGPCSESENGAALGQGRGRSFLKDEENPPTPVVRRKSPRSNGLGRQGRAQLRTDGSEGGVCDMACRGFFVPHAISFRLVGTND